MHDPFGGADATGLSPHHGADQPLGREQRHLRVVGDPPCPSVMRRQILQTIRKAGTDPLEAPELDLGPERIAHGAAEQAGADPRHSIHVVSFLCAEGTMDQGHSLAGLCRDFPG